MAAATLITGLRQQNRWIVVPLGIVAAIAGVDLLAGPGVSLIALLVVGPLVASLRLGPKPTALLAASSVALAIALGVTNDYLDEGDHVTRILPVAVGGALAVAMAWLREQREHVVSLLGLQSSVSRILAESSTLPEARPRILHAIGDRLGWEIGTFWQLDGDARTLRRTERWSAPGFEAPAFEDASGEIVLERGVGLPGRVWEAGQPASIRDVGRDDNFPRAAAAAAVGLRAGFAFPIPVADRVVGVVEFFNCEAKAPEPDYLDTLASLGRHIGQYIERVRVEEAVRGSEALKTAVLDSAFDCLVTMDHDGRVLDFNPAAEKVFGYAREEAIGQEMAELIIPPSLRDRHRRGLAHYLATGEGPILDQRLEITGWRADGSEFPVELAITRISAEGPPLFSGYLRDITERKLAEERAAFLSEATALLNSSLDYERTLQNVARMGVPRFADWSVLDMLDESGELQRRAVAHSEPAKEALVRELDGGYPFDSEASSLRDEAIATGSPRLVEHAPGPPIAGDAEQQQKVRELGFASAIVAPLKIRGEPVGVLSFAVGDGRHGFGESDLSVAEEVAGRAASAIDNATLYRDRSYIARRLQESLLPPNLPEIPGLQLAARYRAAGEENQVGGDFYDIFQTAADEWAAVIGDVRGKGADAAALIGLARHTLRAAAMRDRDPARILATLNEALYREGAGDSFCTALYAGIELMGDGVRVKLTSAGHPLPLVRRADGRVESLGRPGTLVGAVPDLDVHCEPATLCAGDALVLFTDGVTEARSDAALFGEERLASLLEDCRGQDARAVAEAIERNVLEFQDGVLRDDVAILVARVPLDRAKDHAPAEAVPTAGTP